MQNTNASVPAALEKRLSPAACAILLFVMAAALFALDAFGAAAGVSFPLWVSTAFEFAVILLPALMVLLLSRGAVPKKRLGVKRALLVVGMGVTGYFLTGLVTGLWTLLISALSGGRVSGGAMDLSLFAETPLWVLLAAIALTPAVCEEFFFRGVLQKSLSFHPAGAVCATAALFALMHFDLSKLFSTFALGLFIGWVVLRTDNLFAGMTLHFLNNAFSVLLLKGLSALPQAAFDPDALARMLERSPELLAQTGGAALALIGLFLLSVPLFALFLTLFIRDTKKDAAALHAAAYRTRERGRFLPCAALAVCGALMFAAALWFAGFLF